MSSKRLQTILSVPMAREIDKFCMEAEIKESEYVKEALTVFSAICHAALEQGKQLASVDGETNKWTPIHSSIIEMFLATHNELKLRYTLAN